MSPSDTKAGAPDVLLDAKAVRHTFGRAAQCGDAACALAREVAGRMAERLDYVRLDPAWILDAGCGTAPASGLLSTRYPRARHLALDSSLPVLRWTKTGESTASRLKRFLGRRAREWVCADTSALPIAEASVDMVWSNLALLSAQDAERSFREFHRVLDAGGLLMFSTYGPDTLKELRSAFAAADDYPHVHAFADMHDLGDLLVASGFAAPVMDMEKITCTYATPEQLIAELRHSGQTNALSGRRRVLTGRTRWHSMLAAYPREPEGGRIAATFEIVYGHAWKAAPLARKKMLPPESAIVQWLPARKPTD